MCNGSTPDSGSVSEGSNPSGTTKAKGRGSKKYSSLLVYRKETVGTDNLSIEATSKNCFVGGLRNFASRDVRRAEARLCNILIEHSGLCN